jgi:hypothetical protein
MLSSTIGRILQLIANLFKSANFDNFLAKKQLTLKIDLEQDPLLTSILHLDSNRGHPPNRGLTPIQSPSSSIHRVDTDRVPKVSDLALHELQAAFVLAYEAGVDCGRVGDGLAWGYCYCGRA